MQSSHTSRLITSLNSDQKGPFLCQIVFVQALRRRVLGHSLPPYQGMSPSRAPSRAPSPRGPSAPRPAGSGLGSPHSEALLRLLVGRHRRRRAVRTVVGARGRSPRSLVRRPGPGKAQHPWLARLT